MGQLNAQFNIEFAINVFGPGQRDAFFRVVAQFTDIFVSLQGGQNPMTVLLQQGGQLKDMFGGVGAAARAMGGYVLGLVNPFTVAGAAAATLGLAYYQGSQEADRYAESIIMTGNAAQFVTPLSVQTLSGNKVFTDTFSLTYNY